MTSQHALNRLIDLALEEDIGTGDITTETLIPNDAAGQAVITAKETLVLAGMPVARAVFRRLDKMIAFQEALADGATVAAGTCLLKLSGRLRPLLTGERTALNFLQRLSGIATHVRRYMDRLPATSARLVDTRKTTAFSSRTTMWPSAAAFARRWKKRARPPPTPSSWRSKSVRRRGPGKPPKPAPTLSCWTIWGPKPSGKRSR
jgi:hypothetical protein